MRRRGEGGRGGEARGREGVLVRHPVQLAAVVVRPSFNFKGSKTCSQSRPRLPISRDRCPVTLALAVTGALPRFSLHLRSRGGRRSLAVQGYSGLGPRDGCRSLAGRPGGGRSTAACPRWRLLACAKGGSASEL